MKTKKSNILEKSYPYNKSWKELYFIEDKILKIILNTYQGSIISRYEIHDLTTIKFEFKILNKIFECMISKRNNDYGFSLHNIKDPHKFSDISLNKTIENNKYYLYNIYKIIFIVLQNS